MKLQKISAWILIAGLLLAACTPQQTQSPAGPTSPAPTAGAGGEQPEPVMEETPPAGALDAQRWLAERLGIAEDEISLRSFELAEFPNACLGLAEVGEMCAEVITPGITFMFEAGGEVYEVRANMEMSQFRLAGEDDGPKSGPQNEIPAAEAARQGLAEQMGVAPEQVKILDTAEVQWPDSCLGVARPEESCLAVITPGYRVLVDVDGQAYQLNTNADGSAWRVVEISVSAPGDAADSEGAVSAARQLLAQQLGIDEAGIQSVSVEAVEWPDRCLGVKSVGTMCAQMITPGFRVLLEVDGRQYAFHTDQAGGAVVAGFAPLPDEAQSVVEWSQTEGGVCKQVEIGAKDVQYGACGGPYESAELSEERQAELEFMYGDFAAFEAETTAGMVAFAGQGQRMPEESEMRSLAEWAKLVLAESMAVRGEPEEDGLVLTWHREGGFAGFCNDSAIYRSGWVVTSSCKTGQAANYQPQRLTADELERLFEWVDSLEGFETEQKDAATADSMLVRVTFAGDGDSEASAEQQQEIGRFIDRIYTRAAR